MTAALTTHALTKRFFRQVAVDDVSIEVPEGSIYGFLGANGAGKTTTLRLILGLLRADCGSIRLFGKEVRRGGAQGIGALIESPSLYAHLTGRQNLDISRRLLGLPPREIDRVIELVGLDGAGAKRVGGYSLGMRQRLAIARALLGRPRLLILDEPTNGLDPEGILDMRALMRRLSAGEGTTLLVSSHLLAEVEQVATHVAMVHRGRLLLQDSMSALLDDVPLLEIDTGDRAASARVLEQAGFTVDDGGSGRLLVSGGGGPEPQPSDIAQLLVERGQALRHLARRRPSLERVYHRHLALAA